ncbi:hypothetical protein [Nitrosopumilus sp.]|uniref:hypothetical protein n=1 Tax=Nitrosopumilus sp. TaxID=2024843 RepID=UPI00349FF010
MTTDAKDAVKMKTSLLILLAIVLTVIFSSVAYGLVMPMTAQEVLDEFDMIVLGTITDKKQSEGNAPLYTMEIEEVVKQDSFGMSKSVLAIGCNQNIMHLGTPCPSYEIGDRGLFLLVGNNNYEVSFYSQVSKLNCTSKEFLANYRGLEYGFFWTQDGQSKTFFTGKQIDMHYNVNNRDMTEKDYSVMFSANSAKFEYSNVVNGTVNECVGSKMITTSFVPTVMGTYGFNAGSEGVYGISIIDYGSTPLAQHKAGVHGQDTWCRDNLILILKNDNTKPRADNYPACVAKDTGAKLIERNWGFVPPESNAFGYLGGK